MASLKINKNVLLIGGAVVLGLMAALMSVSYVRKRVEEATAEIKFEETEVVVAKRDFEIGEAIGPDDLASRNVPVDFVPADALTMDNYHEYVNRVVRAPIKQGTPLSASALIPASKQFSRVISPGKVAYTLSVNENNSVAGMIAPGDAVDILLSFDGDGKTQEKPDDGSAAVTKQKSKVGDRVVPLLENVTVIATGVKVGESLPNEEEDATYSTITLELDPNQAEQLTLSQKAGELQVLLRNVEDKTPFGLEGLSEKALLSNFGSESDGMSESDDVEFIIGGKS